MVLSLAIENRSSDITIIRSQAESSPSRRLLLNGKRAKLWTKTCFWFAKEAVFRLSKQASFSKQAHFYNFDFVQFKHYSNLPSRTSPLLRNLEHEKIFKRTSMLDKKRFWSKWSKLTQIDFETFSKICTQIQKWANVDTNPSAEIRLRLRYDSPCNIWIYSKPLLVEVK